MGHYHQKAASPGERGKAKRGIGAALVCLLISGCDLLPGEPSPASGGAKNLPAALETSGSAKMQINDPGTLSLLTWNVQALFDGVEAGTEYDDYLEAAGWGDEKYAARLTSLSQALSQISAKAPDVLALQETENSRILERLTGGPLAKYGYQWTFFANNPGTSLGIGVLSRYPFMEAKVHSITWEEETTPRPILELRLQVQDKPLVLLICHWKSKLGGDILTESLRRASARIILRRIREIREDSPDMPVIVMGDLNENHDEFYRQAGSILSALLPDDPKAAELAGFTPDAASPGQAEEEPRQKNQRDFLVLSGEKPPAPKYFHPEATVLYSPWGGELQEGSYYYKNAWETIDHFLLTDTLFDAKGWEFNSAQVIKQEPFINARGFPNSYNPNTGGGLSDHLPLMLILKDAGAE